MSINTLTVGNVGQAGFKPVWVYIDTNNTFTEVQASGFLNAWASQLSESYMAQVTTRVTPNATTVDVSIFNITYSGGDWSLTSPTFGSGVTYSGSLVVGNLSEWSTTTGNLVDSGLATGSLSGTLGNAALKTASASGVSVLSSVTGPVVVNHFALYSDVAGSTSDAQAVARSGAYATVVMASTTVASGNTPTYTDTAGSVGAGYHLRAQLTSGAGGAAAFTVTDANCTTTSIVNFQFITQANAVAVFKVVPGNGSFVVTASADPGAWTGQYILVVAAVA